MSGRKAQELKNPGRLALHPKVSWWRRKWNRIVQLWRIKHPKKGPPDFEVGTVMCLSHGEFISFRIQLEERAGARIDRLHCEHCNIHQHVRLAFMGFGIVCLDCLLKDLNKRYPK